jgi:hypothetical protein
VTRLADLPVDRSLAAQIARAVEPFGPEFPADFREPDEFIPCCMGAIHDGLRGCNCWEPVFDLEQASELQDGPMELASKCCHDCAYRVGSPERAAGEFDHLEGVAHHPGQVFLCHQGVRRVVAWRHPQLGEIPAGPGDYRPPTGADRIWRADGRPGVLCAGWGAIGDRR